MKSLILSIFILTALPIFAGVYGDLEFGDNRDSVTRKLQKSKLVTQTINTSLISRTGLNGIFQCKTPLAGLIFHLYFSWDADGGLQEVTLRSEGLEKSAYSTTLYKAWGAAAQLFTQVYNTPAQNAGYPDKLAITNGGIMMSHIWHKGKKESILLGTGIDKDQCFLAIRFLNQHIEPVKIPSKK